MKRTLTGAAILIVTVGFVLLKQFNCVIFDAFLFILSIGAVHETVKAKSQGGQKIDLIIYLSPAVIFFIFSLEDNLLSACLYEALFAIVLLLYLLLSEMIAMGVSRRHKKEMLGNSAEFEEAKFSQSVTGAKQLFFKTRCSMSVFAYPMLPLSFFFILNHLSYEISYMGVILAFAISMLTDTCALIFGKAFGKHKLIPEVSPGKTIEGFFGGLFGGLFGGVCCFLFFYFTPYFSSAIDNLALYISVFAVVSVLGSVADQLGDLVSSALKREVGIKDYGKLFPGHGGFMDRVDGMMFTATLVCIIFAVVLV